MFTPFFQILNDFNQPGKNVMFVFDCIEKTNNI